MSLRSRSETRLMLIRQQLEAAEVAPSSEAEDDEDVEIGGDILAGGGCNNDGGL